MLLGRRTGKADEFRLPLLYGISTHRKTVGAHPLLQRFHETADASDVWNGIAEGRHVQPVHELFGYRMFDVSRRRATSKVFARIGPFLHICRRTGEAYPSPFGM